MKKNPDYPILFTLLLLLSVILVGCTPPTPALTVAPTATSIPPTAVPTAVPPTALPTATATVTPTPTPEPTDTPTQLPTATPSRTAAPKAVSTKPAADPTAAAVSSKPTTLFNSIQESRKATQALVGLLNEMVAGGGSELCSQLVQTYQSLHNAPVYNLSDQAVAIQHAYDMYRQAINGLDGRAGSFLQCGSAGGTIGSLDLGVTVKAALNSVGLLGRALDLIDSVPDAVAASPLESAIVRMRSAVGDMSGMVNTYLGVPGYKSVYSDYMCPKILADDAAIQPIELDMSNQPQNMQTAYGLYQQALATYRQSMKDMPDTCRAGEHPIGLPLLKSVQPSILTITDLLSSAYDAVKQ